MEGERGGGGGGGGVVEIRVILQRIGCAIIFVRLYFMKPKFYNSTKCEVDHLS